VDIEFYFGTDIPATAGPRAMLDDGTGFATGRDGYDYGWDCDGDVDVDYSGGRRGLGRDGGLGINHFDRNGACATRVNWQITVPNGDYTALVDFGERYSHACEVEGQKTCADGTDNVDGPPCRELSATSVHHMYRGSHIANCLLLYAVYDGPLTIT